MKCVTAVDCGLVTLLVTKRGEEGRAGAGLGRTLDCCDPATATHPHTTLFLKKPDLQFRIYVGPDLAPDITSISIMQLGFK